MNQLKKYVKIFLTAIVMNIMILGSMMSANAAAETIQLGPGTQTNSYIAGVKFSYKVTTDGKYLYCINMHKETAQNVQANLVKGSKNINGGVVYILKNGYPNKSITGDKDKDYYITQTALWWYLDKTTGSSNLGEQFKSDGSDYYGLRQYVKQLVTDGYTHRNDAISIAEVKLAIGAVGGNSMVLKDKYYVSNDIKATTIQNANNYAVSIANAPEGTIIVSSNGTETAYSNAFSVAANDTFKIKVPISSVKDTQMTLKVTATAQGSEQYTAYEYKPVNENMQNVALLEKVINKASSEVTLDIVSSKVTVYKTDYVTKQPIAGAKLVLKDEKGNVVTSWTSTINGHVIRNLANGNYTIEETEAPNGYLLNKNITKFTISDTNRAIKISIENAPKKVVVNITKVDQETNNPLAGAVLVVRKADGTEVARFTTTETAHVLTDLPNGTYTVEEESAPAGYIRNTEKLSFTIDDDHLSHQVTMVNAKEVVVPNTASATSIIMVILGVAFTGAGIEFIKKHARKA